MSILSECILMVYLIVCAVSDLRTRTVDLGLSIATALLGVLMAWVTGGRSPSETGAAIVMGALPGVMIALISWMTGAIGMGDGVFIATAGIYMGIRDISAALIYAWLLSAAWGLAAVTVYALRGKSIRRSAGIPFVSVLTVAIIWMRLRGIYA